MSSYIFSAFGYFFGEKEKNEDLYCDEGENDEVIINRKTVVIPEAPPLPTETQLLPVELETESSDDDLPPPPEGYNISPPPPKRQKMMHETKLPPLVEYISDSDSYSDLPPLIPCSPSFQRHRLIYAKLQENDYLEEEEYDEEESDEERNEELENRIWEEEVYQWDLEQKRLWEEEEEEYKRRRDDQIAEEREQFMNDVREAHLEQLEAQRDEEDYKYRREHVTIDVNVSCDDSDEDGIWRPM